jgi:hypothetical protein
LELNLLVAWPVGTCSISEHGSKCSGCDGMSCRPLCDECFVHTNNRFSMKRLILFFLWLSFSTLAAQWSPNQISGLQLWLDPSSGCKRSGLLTNSGVVDTWLDLSGNGRHCTNNTALPTYQPRTATTPNFLRFFGTNYLIVSSNGLPIASTQTNWTVCYVARIYDPYTANSAIFDITEQTLFQSILARSLFIASSFALQEQVRDESNVSNTAQISEDLAPFRVITATRSGNTITLRINSTPVSTNSANTIGVMDTTFFGTIGAVRNQAVPIIASYLSGDVMFLTVFNSTLSSDQITALERFAEGRFNVPLIYPTRYTTNPVVALGTGSDLDRGRILEPSVLIDGATWKMWYCGSTNNSANTNLGWHTFYATSSDGLTWTKQGLVLSNTWEADVIKIAGSNLFYMVAETNTGYNIRFYTSSDGVSWADQGVIINNSDATWITADAPREPSLYWENGTFYCYFAGYDGRYKIGLSVCSGNPLYHSNWVCQASAFFASTQQLPGWNSGGDTESPCVRFYASFARPYVMTFTSYNSLYSTVNKPWRNGVAWAASPSGPFTDTSNNPWLSIGINGGWDDRIAAETTHVLSGNTAYVFYSGGKGSATNQVGLVTISRRDWANLAR